VFSVTVGFFESGTRRITENRILRWSDGFGESLLRTGQKAPNGTIVELSIADLNQSGDLLVIAGVNRRTTRSLFLLPRSADPNNI
jgi:hypothetical protein